MRIKSPNAKRYVLHLTAKQVDAITTALFEWGDQEGELDTPEGRRNEKHMRATSKSIERQCEAINKKRREAHAQNQDHKKR